MPAEPTPKRTSLVGVQALAPHWNLESPTEVVREAKTATAAPQVELVLHVLATLAAVILLGAFLGGICQRIGQPPVIGEIFAGLLLGPSLLGRIYPDAMHFLIPAVALSCAAADDVTAWCLLALGSASRKKTSAAPPS